MSQVLTITLVFLSFAVFLQLLSVAIPYWSSTPRFNYGLWKICSGGNCISNTMKEDFFLALKALQVLGLLLGISSIVTILIGKLTKLLSPKVVRIASPSLTIATGVIILIGIIEYSIKGYNLSACFAMSLISAFCCAVIGGRLTVSEEQ